MKRTRSRATWLVIGFAILLGPTHVTVADTVRAFSLREANRRVQAGGTSDPELSDLAGVTRVAGMVFDQQTADVILVGEVGSGQPSTVWTIWSWRFDVVC